MLWGLELKHTWEAGGWMGRMTNHRQEGRPALSREHHGPWEELRFGEGGGDVQWGWSWLSSLQTQQQPTAFW